MVARVKPPSALLVVQFEREGNEPIRIEVADGEKAILRAVTILMMHKRLQPGDVLRVVPANE